MNKLTIDQKLTPINAPDRDCEWACDVIHDFIPPAIKQGFQDKKFVDFLVESVIDKTGKFAGFASKKYLAQTLKQQVLGTEKEDFNQLKSWKYNKEQTEEIIRESLQELAQKLPSKNQTEVFVFPTLSQITAKQLGGVTGFTPWQNIIHLYIYPKIDSKKSFPKTLIETLAHEYNHSIRMEHQGNDWTLGGWLVNEGLAEHFRQDIFGDSKANYSTALTYNQAKQVFQTQLKDKLESEDHILYDEVFFGSKNFKKWTGYSVGYWLVNDYLKTTKKDWIKIIKLPAKKIIKEAGW